MKKTLAAAILLASLVSCNSGRYHIQGYISNPEADGAIVYLVPVMEKVHEPSKDNLDSTFIKDNRFEFYGKKERMVNVRLEYKRRYGTQELLLVTEPGEISVNLGPSSSCFGTPQNDSLQTWKEMTEKMKAMSSGLRRAGYKHEADSVWHDYFKRTGVLARNVGDSTTLGKFLYFLYPTLNKDE